MLLRRMWLWLLLLLDGTQDVAAAALELVLLLLLGQEVRLDGVLLLLDGGPDLGAVGGARAAGAGVAGQGCHSGHLHGQDKRTHCSLSTVRSLAA